MYFPWLPWFFVFVILLYMLIGTTMNLHEHFAGTETGKEEATKTVSAEFVASYKAFLAVYTSFMEQWQKAIVTAIGLERPAPPAAAAFVPPTFEEMNHYLGILQQKQQQSYPPVVDLATLPSTDSLTPATIDALSHVIPEDPKTMVRAVQWMNQRLTEAIQALPPGTGTGSEHFVGSQCQDMEGCLDNPDFLDRLAAAQAARQAKQRLGQQERLQKRMEAIVKDTELAAAMKKNAELVARSAEIQKQATSGQLLSSLAGSIGASSEEPTVTYTLPPGANKSFDPNAFKEFKGLLGMKSSLDQINRGLR